MIDLLGGVENRESGKKFSMLQCLCKLIPLVGSVLLIFGQAFSQDIIPGAGDQVAEVLGKPVYRNQTVPPELKFPIDNERTRALHRQSQQHLVILKPVLEKFQSAHQSEIVPTAEEIKFTVVFFEEEHRKKMDKVGAEWERQRAEIETKLEDDSLAEKERTKLRSQLKILEMKSRPPGDELAWFLMKNLKWQRYLYRHYGGGRVVFQQGGVEAFDAMRAWIEEREKQGDFKITDPALRTEFYAYWTTWDHGAFLTDDPMRIKKSLNPPWAAPQ